MRTNLNIILAALMVVFLFQCQLKKTKNATDSFNKSDIKALYLSDADSLVEKGRQLFRARCTSCHQLDRVTVGPALAKSFEKYDYDYEWFAKYTWNNYALRQSGDQRAIDIYDKYDGASMPPYRDLTSDEMSTILSYMKYGGKQSSP